MNVREAKALVPWWAKIGAKIVLSRLPLGYGGWRRLQLFRHGAMTDPGYAERVFAEHWAEVPEPVRGTGPVLLELGPGDSLLSALLGARHGAATTYLVDAGRFALDNVAFYREAATRIGLSGPAPAEGGAHHRPGSAPLGTSAAGDWQTLDDVLQATRAAYLTNGLASLQAIPSGSVDFVWSQAVLEHLWLEEFAPTARELRRILRSGGAMSHVVDFRDHLGGNLNSLRFSAETWEGALFRGSGFYTNRLRLSQVKEEFVRAGFRVEVRSRQSWSELPTSRAVMEGAFAALPDEDLLTSLAHLVMVPA